MLFPRLLCLLFLSLAKGAILPVTFDDDCSNVECPPEPSVCPADSLERSAAPVFDVLYSPDEFMLPQEFYDDDTEPIKEDKQNDETLLQQPADTKTSTVSTTIVNSMANSTSSPLLYTLTAEHKESHVETESKRRKRELIFDDKNIEDADEHELKLHTCCSTMRDEQLQLRRRRRVRRHSTLEDCECKPCAEVPACPSAEVLIKVQEAAGTPGDCCPSWACAPKKSCDDVDVQPYWRDACTRCSCYGTKGPELCHNECPALEEQETEQTCFTADTLQPMEHGSVWYENDYCTKCHCENGMRDCVESLCKPATCKSPHKVVGQCCPQCSEDDENILVLQENSTHLNRDDSGSTEIASQTTVLNATSATPLVSSTTEPRKSTNASSTELTKEPMETANTTLPTALGNTTTDMTSGSAESSTEFTNNFSSTQESSTEPNSQQNQTTSTETRVELFNASTSEEFSSSTELTSTSKAIDEIAAEGYFGPVESTSAGDNTTISEEPTEKISETTLEAAETTTSATQNSSESDSTESLSSSSTTQLYELDSTSTTSMASSSSIFSYSESTTEQSTSSTEHVQDLSTSSSSSTDESTAGVFTTDAMSSPTTPQETAESTSSASSSTNTYMDSSTSSILTTLITTSTTLDETSSTQTLGPSKNSPHTSSFNLPTSTTNSPFAYTSPTSTVTYWYTFSTSAPSPPMPQPTVYQPSVRQFFTKPEVRYIGAIVFVAFLGICALAVWKFCMPARNTRRKLKNHYRTVPSSEATSLSHSPTTSHSSMA